MRGCSGMLMAIIQPLLFQSIQCLEKRLAICTLTSRPTCIRGAKATDFDAFAQACCRQRSMPLVAYPDSQAGACDWLKAASG